jgi:hypothetical protein
VDGVDDLGVVDASQVYGGDPEIGMPELALDDDQRHAFPRHFHCVRVPELMRREPPAHARGDRRVTQLDAEAGR